MESVATKERAVSGRPQVPARFRTLFAVPRTVLVVEDEGFVREATCEILRTSGYEVLPAQNAATARALFLACGKPVVLLLCDVVLPDKNGVSLARALRRISPRLKVVFVSGYPAATASSGRRRTTRFLPKPYSAASLIVEMQLALQDKPPRMEIHRRQAGAR